MPFELAFEDSFDVLDERRWLPAYLPHWSSRVRAAARYAVGGGLRLRIDADQPAWCPEWDGDVRVSSLQTGTRDGQHRFHPDAVVREPQVERRLFLPRYGRVELRARASGDANAMCALWLIGFEDAPERSGELCVCEIFGRDVGPRETHVGMGIHPFGDPALRDDFAQVALPIDAREPHEYTAEWTPGRSDFLVDGEPVRSVDQAPDYPLQLMLGIYAFSGDGPHPKELAVERLRAWRWTG